MRSPVKPSLVELLRELEQPSQPIPVDGLAALSDLDADSLRDWKPGWDRLAPQRRRELLVHLRRLSDERIELSFERLNRLAVADPDPEVRCQAIGNLWESEDASLVPLLVRALEADPATAVRQAAASALGVFVYLGEVDRIPDEFRRQAEESLLRSAGNDPEAAVRVAGLESLGYSSRGEIPGLIEAAYRSGEEGQVRSALVAMGRSANGSWAPAVTSELASPSPLLRLEAARAAGELDLRATVPALVDLLDDTSDDVRRASIWSLGQLGGDQAERALQALLRRDPPQDEATLIEEALENLAFVDGTRDFLLLDFEDGGNDET